MTGSNLMAKFEELYNNGKLSISHEEFITLQRLDNRYKQKNQKVQDEENSVNDEKNAWDEMIAAINKYKKDINKSYVELDEYEASKMRKPHRYTDEQKKQVAEQRQICSYHNRIWQKQIDNFLKKMEKYKGQSKGYKGDIDNIINENGIIKENILSDNLIDGKEHLEQAKKKLEIKYQELNTRLLSIMLLKGQGQQQVELVGKFSIFNGNNSKKETVAVVVDKGSDNSWTFSGLSPHC